MQSAMNEAAARAAMNQLFFDPFAASSYHTQFLMLNVSRENIVADTLLELSRYNSSDLKKPLRVSIIVAIEVSCAQNMTKILVYR